jgi:hypothetical protein
MYELLLIYSNEKRVRKFSQERRDSGAAQDVFEVCGCVFVVG